KVPGDKVISAAINLTGFLRIRATRVGSDTTLSGIVKMVSEAAATKAPVARLADRISSVFVPAVMGIALVTFAVWMIIGAGVSYSLARAVSVLVVSCPCALGLATPVAIMVGTGLGAKHGILFKTAGALQEAGKTRIAALDKTGTITTGNIRVSEIRPCEGVGREHFVRLISAAESGSEHPVGKAVAELGDGPGATGFTAYPGSGISAVVDGHEVFAGNREFMAEHCSIGDEDAPGRIFASEDGRYIGYVTVSDTIKDDSREAVEQLRKMGIYTVMLTGDGEAAALRIAEQAGVDQVVSHVTPADKKDVIMQLKEYGRCAMTGDGINDAPALTEADTGVAIGAGTDVAIDSADIVLMSSSLKDLAAAVRLSGKTYSNILQNLFWALFYNVLLIPAACGLYASFGITMTPALGALAMSLSSVCVVLNALRLNMTDIYKTTGHGRPAVITTKIPITVREVKTMTKTMKIKGMMCEHCEARVVKTLEKIEGVTSASANHVTGEAVVNMTSEVSDDVLRNAVTEQDYEVISIS
ncbi:MAG: cadmium-translocating P-type ATPase, partial [Clostridiales bacterium]|nr:cadmium-translocating P-type ATPase [Clostridiales bacterium]